MEEKSCWIGRAARICHAAAHGGQILASEIFMEQLLADWTGASEKESQAPAQSRLAASTNRRIGSTSHFRATHAISKGWHDRAEQARCAHVHMAGCAHVPKPSAEAGRIGLSQPDVCLCMGQSHQQSVAWSVRASQVCACACNEAISIRWSASCLLQLVSEPEPGWDFMCQRPRGLHLRPQSFLVRAAVDGITILNDEDINEYWSDTESCRKRNQFGLFPTPCYQYKQSRNQFSADKYIE